VVGAHRMNRVDLETDNAARGGGSALARVTL